MSKRSLDSPDVSEESRTKRLWLESSTEINDVEIDAMEVDNGVARIGMGYIALRILQGLMTVPAGYGLQCEQLTEYVGVGNERQTWVILNSLLRQHLVCASDDHPPYWLITAEGYQVACSLLQNCHGNINSSGSVMSML